MASAAVARPLLVRSLLRGARSPALAVRWAKMAVAPRRNHARFSVSLDSINPNLRRVQYAVRGPILDRAMAIQQDLDEVKKIYYNKLYILEAHGSNTTHNYITFLCVVRHFDVGSDNLVVL